MRCTKKQPFFLDFLRSSIIFALANLYTPYTQSHDEHNLQTGTDWLLASIINAD